MTIQTLNPKEEQLEMSEDNKMLTLVDGCCFFLWFRGQMLSLLDTADSTNELISCADKYTKE